MKNRLSFFIIIALMIFLVGSGTASNSGISVTVDNTPLSFDVPPVMESGRTLVPLRAIFESLGASVQFDGSTQKITAVKGTTTVQLTINSADSTVNGTPVKLDVPAKVINGRTLVPLRFIGEAFGAQVDWISSTRSIKITPKAEQSNLLNGSILWQGANYNGDLVNGVPHGYGSLTFPNGDRYTGQFNHGIVHGIGTIYWITGDTFTGQFSNGDRDGFGTYKWQSGDTYYGYYKNNLPHGSGTYIWPDGSKFVGTYENGYRHGFGAEYYPDGTVALLGMWSYDIYIGGTTSTTLSSGSLKLYADDINGTYLGKLTTNTYNSESIFNKYGTYGSEYSSKSIWNKYGTYGSEYSSYSAFNKYAFSPPKIVDSNGKVIGRVTVNEFIKGAITPYSLFDYLKGIGF